MNNSYSRSRLLPAVLFLLSLFLVPLKYAHAYIDPGSGSFIWQMLLAGFFTFLFMLRQVRERIKRLIASYRSKKGND